MKHIIPICAFLSMMAACSGQKSQNGSDKDSVAQIKEPSERVRPAAKGGTSAAYFRYTNNLDMADTLLSVNTDIAGMAEVHEMYESGQDMMAMRPVKDIILQPGENLLLEPGGKHIMLMKLTRGLNEGDSVMIHLSFAVAGDVSRKLPVSLEN